MPVGKKERVLPSIEYELYDDVLNNLPDAICVIDLKANEVKYVNETFSRQLLSHNQIIGHSFESKILQEDTREIFSSCVKKAQTTSHDVEIGCCRSLSCIGKDKFPLYKNYFWIVRKINDDSVMVRGNIDIEKNEILYPGEADDYTNELLDFLVKAPICMHWLSPTGHILWANDAELDSLGYSKEEYIGHHIKEFCPDEEAALNKCHIELSAGRAIFEEPFKFQTKSGKIKHLIVDSNVSKNAEGTFIFMRDDTERRVEEQISDLKLKSMKSLNNMKDSFIRRIFHDIKTPLHVISDCLTEIEESIENNTVPRLDDVALIEQNIGSILSVSEDVNYSLEFNEGRTISINPLPFDIESSIRDIAAYVETIERNSSQILAFDYQFDESLSMKNHVLADSAIYRVLFHLIRNAVRFSPRLSNIKIEVKYLEVSRQHKVKITNNTENPVDLKAINDSFHNSYSCMRSDAPNGSLKITESLTDVRGLGLGLYVSYNLIQAMGGMLECSKVDGSDLVTFQFHLKLPTTGKGSPPTNLRKTSISCLLKRESVRIWTDMCDAEAARTHVIEDSEDSMMKIISKSSKSSKSNKVLSDDEGISSKSNYNGSLRSKSILKPTGTSTINLSAINLSSKYAMDTSTKDVSTVDLSVINLFSKSLIGISSKGVSSKSQQQTLTFASNITGGTSSNETTTSYQPQPPVAMNQSSKSRRPSFNRTIIDPTENEEKNNTTSTQLKQDNNHLLPSPTPLQLDKRQISLISTGSGSSKSSNSATRKSVPRILVVDDSPMCQRVLIRILTSDGYDVDTANNGLEAVEKLSIEPCIYKACLMDLRMPIMDGITATKICRQKSHLKALRIIVITAEHGEHILSQVKDAGANYLIPKPAAAGVIKQAIEFV